MTDLVLERLQDDQIQSFLRPFWLDINQLAGRLPAELRSESQKILGEIRALIFRNEPVARWEPRSSDSFHRLAAEVILTERKRCGQNPVAEDSNRLQVSTNRLCNLASIAEITPETRLAVARVWLAIRLPELLVPPEMPENIAVAAVQSFERFDISADLLLSHMKAQIVCHIVCGGSNAPSDSDWARLTCAELIQNLAFRDVLAEAASALGVEVPTEPAAEEKGSTKEPKRDAELRILALPPALTEAEFEERLQNILFDLPAYAEEKDTALHARTISQAKSLSEQTRPEAMKSTLYFAASDIWRGYWARGDRKLLPMAADLALYVHCYNVAHVKEISSADRSNSLHLWMNMQFARKIRTCTLHELMVDAARLCDATKTRRNDLWVRQAVIEASAGECKALEGEKNLDARNQFLTENWKDLCEIHEQYRQRIDDARLEPRQDEEMAWDYLRSLPHPQIEPPPSTSIRTDADFQRVINRGATEDIYQFAVSRNEDVQRILEKRLDVLIGLDHVMEPKGEIFDPLRNNVLHPGFADALKILHEGNFSRAASLFERLSGKVQGIYHKIARDYQAYALAKQGLRMPAQLPLEDICQDDYRYASGYWNLACCLLSQDMDQQLETLVRGLKAAPDPRLLRGAVLLALYLNDPRLREWLPCLTLTEALLLYYRLDVEQGDLTNQQKRDHVLRLGHYAVTGEPTMPDPAQARIPDSEVQKFLNSVLERNQTVAFEFWLRCRELSAKNQYNHWEVKTDFLEKTNRKAEAAKAFQEELKNRLRYLGILAGKRDPRRFDLLAVTSRRLANWLAQCMTPELKHIGLSLCTSAQQFQVQYAPAKVLPATKRIREFYGLDEPETGRLEPPPPPPPQPAPDGLSKLLTKAGQESQARLRDVADLPLMRPLFNDLLDGLRTSGHRLSAEQFQRLLQQWEGYNRLSTEGERLSSLRAGHVILTNFKRELERELNNEVLFENTRQLFYSLKRFSDRLVRDSGQLPRLLLEPITGARILIDSDAETPSFPVRIRCEGCTTARLKDATATFDNGETECTLRDRLEEVTISVGAEQTAVLTFALPKGMRLTEQCRLSVAITFEFAGGDHRTEPVELDLEPQPCPPLPLSPYIFNRPLQPDEIEGHFFGRTDEQEMLLSSVRDGQQNLRYVEGIRRAGKSSLLNSIEHEVKKRNLPLIPIVVSAASAKALDHAGKLLHSFFEAVVGLRELATCGIEVPTEQRCCDNMAEAYAQFTKSLANRLPDRRILALLDDFNQLVDAASEMREHLPAFTNSVVGFLNIIFATGNPHARLLWIFTGHKMLQQYRRDLPGADLWGILGRLAIDFLKLDAVKEILTQPLKDTCVVVTPEAISLVHRLTAGHPELVQKIGEYMLGNARQDRRFVLTPADAHEGARYLALFSDDPFAGAWYPEAELKKEPETLRLLVNFLKKVPVGGRIELAQLVAPNPIAEKDRRAAEDLIARKILDRSDGALGVQAYVLDLWLHRMVKDVQWEEPGSPAIFIDVANLTAGKGTDTVTNLHTQAGDGVPGRFALRTVLDAVEAHVYQFTKVPVAAKWVVNYPPRCPAVMECSAKDYRIANIPDELQRKAVMTGKSTDDQVLMGTIDDVAAQYPNVQHFFLVTGDIDYSVKIRSLLQRGKYVHLVSRASALGSPDAQYSYQNLAAKHPERFTLKRLEELLEQARSADPTG